MAEKTIADETTMAGKTNLLARIGKGFTAVWRFIKQVINETARSLRQPFAVGLAGVWRPACSSYS